MRLHHPLNPKGPNVEAGEEEEATGDAAEVEGEVQVQVQVQLAVLRHRILVL